MTENNKADANYGETDKIFKNILATFLLLNFLGFRNCLLLYALVLSPALLF
jgi:hypothetical protein